jgi:hypothetical protein
VHQVHVAEIFYFRIGILVIYDIASLIHSLSVIICLLCSTVSIILFADCVCWIANI